MEILRYKEVNKGALVSTFTLRVPIEGRDYNECAEFSMNGKRWLGFLSRQYEKDGQKKYLSAIFYFDKQKQEIFENMAWNALDAYKKAMRQTVHDQVATAQTKGHSVDSGKPVHMSFQQQVFDEELPF